MGGSRQPLGHTCLEAMRLLIGLTALLAAFTIATLTALAVKSAGGIDILTFVSFFVVLLFAVAGIGALRDGK